VVAIPTMARDDVVRAAMSYPRKPGPWPLHLREAERGHPDVRTFAPRRMRARSISPPRILRGSPQTRLAPQD